MSIGPIYLADLSFEIIKADENNNIDIKINTKNRTYHGKIEYGNVHNSLIVNCDNLQDCMENSTEFYNQIKSIKRWDWKQDREKNKNNKKSTKLLRKVLSPKNMILYSEADLQIQFYVKDLTVLDIDQKEYTDIFAGTATVFGTFGGTSEDILEITYGLSDGTDSIRGHIKLYKSLCRKTVKLHKSIDYKDLVNAFFGLPLKNPNKARIWKLERAEFPN